MNPHYPDHNYPGPDASDPAGSHHLPPEGEAGFHPNPDPRVFGGPQKSFVATWLLSWLLGLFGADRFYLGKVGTGILKLITLGGLGVWYLIDLIMVLCGAARTKAGQPVKGQGTPLAVAWAVTAASVILGGITGATAGSTGDATDPDLNTVADGADTDDQEDAAAAVEDDTAETEPAEETESAEEEDAPTVEAEDEQDDAEEDQAVVVEEPESDDSEADAEWITSTFGDFDPLQESGAGDSVVSLPDDAAGGIITADHQGGSNFVINVLDETNQSTGDLLVNTIGNYAGTTAWGLSTFGDGTRLEITADGPWNIEVLPYSEAEELPDSSAGDGVFIYDGAAGVLATTHDGQSNFVVREEADQLFSSGLLINEIGPYEGTVPVQAGPSIFVVEADGNWTVSID